MSSRFRPPFATSVALVGATIIASSTVTPPPDSRLPDARVPAVYRADVNLASVVHLPQTYQEVFDIAGVNVNHLTSFPNNPARVVERFIADQIMGVLNGQAAGTETSKVLATAVNQLMAANVEGAATTLAGIAGVLSRAIEQQGVVWQTIRGSPWRR